MLMAISILGALYKRQKTGQGRRLQVAMQDAMIHYMRVPFSRTQLTGKAPPRGGSAARSPAAWCRRPCTRASRAARTIMSTSSAAAPTPNTGNACCSVMGREDLSGDARSTLRMRAASAPPRPTS